MSDNFGGWTMFNWLRRLREPPFRGTAWYDTWYRVPLRFASLYEGTHSTFDVLKAYHSRWAVQQTYLEGSWLRKQA